MSVLAQSLDLNNYYTRIGAYYRRPEIKVVGSLTLSIIAIVLLSTFAIKPTIVTISNLLREIKDKQELNTAFDKKITQLTQAQNELIAYKEQLPLLDQALPTQSFSTDLIRQVEYLISRNGLTLQGASYQGGPIDPELVPPVSLQQKAAKEKKAEKALAEEGLTGVTPSSVNLRVSGNYDQIASLVSDLNHLSRLLIIRQLVISQPVSIAGVEPEGLAATIQLQAFYTNP